MTFFHVGKASRMASYARELFVSFVFWERMVPISTSKGSPRWRVGFPYFRASKESMVARLGGSCLDRSRAQLGYLAGCRGIIGSAMIESAKG